MSIDHHREKEASYPSRQPLYRLWSYLCRKTLAKGIPMQRSWRKSFNQFKLDVGTPPDDEPYQLVTIEPSMGYVWNNVTWLPKKRAERRHDLEWLRYKEKRKEISVWAAEFGTTLCEFKRLREKGWTMRKIDCHFQKARQQEVLRQIRVVRAGRTRPNPART